MPQFLLLMRLAELRKQGVDVTDLAAKILTPEDLSTGTVERGSAIQCLEECCESRNDASDVQEDQVEDTHDAGGVYQDEPPGMVGAISERSTGGEDSEGMQEVEGLVNERGVARGDTESSDILACVECEQTPVASDSTDGDLDLVPAEESSAALEMGREVVADGLEEEV